MTLAKRKSIRLKGYDYDSPGYYFITVCTKGKKKLLCEIVGTAVPGGPLVQLTDHGFVVQNHLQRISDFYPDIKVNKYVVMPNHIHLLIHVLEGGPRLQGTTGGPPSPAVPMSKVSRFVGTLKGLCTRECGQTIWQGRFHDHIVRNERDYLRIWTYIDQNPAKWEDDCFYTE